jgi:hypothetical protein
MRSAQRYTEASTSPIRRAARGLDAPNRRQPRTASWLRVTNLVRRSAATRRETLLDTAAGNSIGIAFVTQMRSLDGLITDAQFTGSSQESSVKGDAGGVAEQLRRFLLSAELSQEEAARSGLSVRDRQSGARTFPPASPSNAEPAPCPRPSRTTGSARPGTRTCRPPPTEPYRTPQPPGDQGAPDTGPRPRSPQQPVSFQPGLTTAHRGYFDARTA